MFGRSFGLWKILLIMKKLFFALFLPFLFPALDGISQDNMEVHLRQCQFFAPQKGTYVETYLMIPGNQLQYPRNQEGKYQGAVEVTMYFEQDGQVQAVEKYNLKSMALEDSVFVQDGLVDQRRFLLDPGTYHFKAKFKDVHQPELTHTITDTVKVSAPDQQQVAVSGIQTLENFSQKEEETQFNKHGYELVPKVTNFYPKGADKLRFYAEIYNTDEKLGDEQFLTTYYIKNYQSGKVKDEYGGFEKMEAGDRKVLLKSISIEDLETGNYNLVIEVVDQNKTLLAKHSFFFQRSNPAKTSDYSTKMAGQDIENSFVKNFGKEEVTYQLESMAPIANARKTRQIYQLLRNDADKETMQRFMLRFWQNRDPADPYGAWYQYSKKVEEVNKHFETPQRHGFETERGRVYLQYGAPNEIISSPREPGGDPYEIWHYDQLDNQGTAKFVFHDEDLVTNNYKLIHSTANGEIKNENWKSKIYNTFPGDDSDMKQGKSGGQDHFGRSADEYFDE